MHIRVTVVVCLLLAAVVWLGLEEFSAPSPDKEDPLLAAVVASPRTAEADISMDAPEFSANRSAAAEAPTLSPAAGHRELVSGDSSEGLIRVGATRSELRLYAGSGIVVFRDLHRDVGELMSRPVVQGRWAWPDTLEDDYTLVIDHLLLDEGIAIPVDVRYYSPAVDPSRRREKRTIDALWAGQLTFRVVDAQSSEPLEHVDIRYSTWISPLHMRAAEEVRLRRQLSSGNTRGAFTGTLHSHASREPGPDCAVLARDASSPVRVERRSELGTHWISAPGYEWYAWPGEDATDEDPLLIRLKRTGTVQIHIDRSATPTFLPGLRLRLYPSAAAFHNPLKEWEIGNTRLYTADRLVPQQYRVQLQYGDHEELTHIVASETVEVHAGEMAIVTLATYDFPSEPAALNGHLFVETAMGESSDLSLLEVRRENGAYSKRLRLSLANSGSGYLHYEFEEIVLEPGEYVLRTVGLPIEWTVTIEPGENYLDLEVLDLRERWIDVRDKATGDPLSLVTLAWGARIPLGQDADASLQVSHYDTLTADENPVRVVLPAIALEVYLQSLTHGHHSTEIDVVAGQTHIRIDVPSRACVEVLVVDQGKNTHFSFEWLRRIQVLDRSGDRIRVQPTWKWSGDGAPSAKLWFEEAGTYRLVPPSLPGLSSLSPVDVAVEEGMVSEVRFTSDRN